MSENGLGPGDTNTLFQIPIEDWKNINQHVWHVWAGVRGEQFYIFNDFPNYQDLINVCNTWKSTTFPGIVSFANTILSAIESITKNFKTMQPTVTAIEHFNIPDVMPPEFTSAVNSVQQEISALKNQITPLKNQIDSFSKENQTADKAYTNNPKWQKWADASQVDKAFGLVMDGWDSISADITQLQKEVSSAIAKGVADDNFGEGNELGEAITKWNSAKGEIQTFLTNTNESLLPDLEDGKFMGIYGRVRTDLNGQLLTPGTIDGAIYWIDNGLSRWIPNDMMLETLFNQNTIVEVPIIPKLGDPVPLGSFLYELDEVAGVFGPIRPGQFGLPILDTIKFPIYLLEGDPNVPDSIRREISSPEIFVRNNFGPCRVRVYPGVIQHSVGPPLT